MKHVEDMSASAMEAVMGNPWPGNVRELRNAIEHAVTFAPGGTILPEHLPMRLREPCLTARRDSLGTIDAMEQRYIEEALARFPNKTRAAEVLGISLRTLYNKRHRYAAVGLAAAATPARRGG